MESYRQGHRVTVPARHRQGGITVIGFLILASLFGVVGLAGMKLVPMYLQNMRLSTILDDMETEFNGEPTPATIKTSSTSVLRSKASNCQGTTSRSTKARAAITLESSTKIVLPMRRTFGCSSHSTNR